MEENKVDDQRIKKITLMTNRLMNLGEGDYEKDKCAHPQDLKRGILQRDQGIEEWEWPQGVGLYGLYKLQSYWKDNRYMDFFNRWYRRHLECGLPSRNINTTAPYLALVELAEVLETPEIYRDLCIKHADWLMNGLAKTMEGGFQHVTTAIQDRNEIMPHESELWIDTLFMAVLFLNKIGYKYCRQDWIDEASRQMLIHIKYLYDKHSGLFFHGWSFNRRDNFGGVFWCRGNSWFTYAVPDYLDDCGSRINAGFRHFLVDTYRAQVEALVSLQSKSGLWHTVLNDAGSYEEVSGSAAITAGILKGLRMGLLDNCFRPVAIRGLEAVCQNIDSTGTVLHVSAGTSIGMDAEHYKNIVISPMAYGQALALLALYESLEE